MKDKLGQALSIGDRIIFNPPKYKGIVFGYVEGLTLQKVKIRYNSEGKQTNDITYMFFNDVVKVTPEK